MSIFPKLGLQTKIRWEAFKRQKISYFCFIGLLSAFFVSLFAEFYCNEKPILLSYKGSLCVPIFQFYPETFFGGVLETEADYRGEFMQSQLQSSENWAIWPLIPFGPRYIDFSLQQPAPSPPSRVHILGTDDFGRDVLARLIYGFRVSLVFSICLAIASTVLGILIGALQGYFGGVVDLVFQRLIEIWSSLPELLVLITITSLFRPSMYLTFVLMTSMGWMGLAAYMRAEFLKARKFEFVESPIALGARSVRVMWKHILPNTLTPLITFFPFRVSAVITGLASLEFLGFDVLGSKASLGELLEQGKTNLHSWWIILATFCVMVATIAALNFIGEGFQKTMDPKRTLSN